MTDEANEITIRADGPVAWVTIDRPEKRNALSNGMLARIGKALKSLAEDRANRVVVFTGSGDKFFSSGFDISEIASLPEGGGPSELAPNLVEETMIRVAEFPKPTIACLNGSAFGTGCELATACDLRVAAAGIEMAMPPARVGVLYSAAASSGSSDSPARRSRRKCSSPRVARHADSHEDDAIGATDGRLEEKSGSDRNRWKPRHRT